MYKRKVLARVYCVGWLLLGLAAASSAAMAQNGGRVVDRAVAVVEGRVITLSELTFEARVLLVQAGGVRAAFEPLDEETLRGALDRAIGFRLEAAEADKLSAYSLDEGEVEAGLRAFKARFATEAEFQRFLDRHEADVQMLATVIARTSRAAKILDSKLRLKAQVSEADVKRFYEQHREELNAPYEEVRAAIRQKLLSEQLERLTTAELERIRRTADVRVLAPFAKKANGSGSGSR